MNPVPVLLIILTTLAFETVFIGQDVNRQIAPYTFTVDTHKDDCTNPVDVACGLGNFARPLLSVLALIGNAILFVGGLVTFQVPGAPGWVQVVFGGGFSITLIWCLVELLRGKGS